MSYGLWNFFCYVNTFDVFFDLSHDFWLRNFSVNDLTFWRLRLTLAFPVTGDLYVFLQRQKLLVTFRSLVYIYIYLYFRVLRDIYIYKFNSEIQNFASVTIVFISRVFATYLVLSIVNWKPNLFFPPGLSLSPPPHSTHAGVSPPHKRIHEVSS